jgi:Uma2 family endonuclease
MSRSEFEGLSDARFAEWLEGECVVNPPVPRHGRIIARLIQALGPAVPIDFELYVELGVRTADADFVPDLTVASATATGAWLLDPPPLVIEVLSPSTRSLDLGYKRDAYASHGCPWYWVVDPDGPSLTVLHNVAGRFVQEQRIVAAGATVNPIAAYLDLVTICR